MCVSICLHVHVYNTCVQCSQRQEDGIRFPGTGIQVVVSHHTDAGSWTEPQCKSIKGPPLLSHLPSPKFDIIIIIIVILHYSHYVWEIPMLKED